MAQEMVTSSKKNHTSLPFSVWITELYRCSRVLREAKKNVEVIPTSFVDLGRIEGEYIKDEAEKKKVSTVDTSSVLDMDTLPVEAHWPPAHGPSSTSSIIPFDVRGSSTTTLPP